LDASRMMPVVLGTIGPARFATAARRSISMAPPQSANAIGR
jgi:hypothetical protein